MNHIIKDPSPPLRFFLEICGIPHRSGDERYIHDYLTYFARERGLAYKRDDMLNLLIKKPGTAGRENSPAVVLQSHMDMVYERAENAAHTYGQPLDLAVRGDRLFARGTSLGADNGVGMGIMLALLDATDIPHPPLEMVFTTREEDGLIGAAALSGDWLSGRRLINLDGEEEDQLIVGCAGAFCGKLHIPVRRTAVPPDTKVLAVRIDGLTGGHSGLAISRQYGNANKLMGRILADLLRTHDILVSGIEGGTRMNSIPTWARAYIVYHASEEPSLKQRLLFWSSQLHSELARTDSGVTLTWEAVTEPMPPFDTDSIRRVIGALLLTPDGVLQMSREVEGLVQTSSNLGRVETDGGRVTLICNPRSSVGMQKEAIREQLRVLADNLSAQAVFDSEYPPWEYTAQSCLRDTYTSEYEKAYGRPPRTEILHGGLECGVLAEKYSGMDAISVGPDIASVHSVAESVSFSSIDRFWHLLWLMIKRL